MPATTSSEKSTVHAFKKKKRKRLSPSDRRIKLREQIWPGAEKEIWHRLENDGFITIPKLLSLVCALLKQIAKNDPTRTYIDLWCRSFDEGIIESLDESEASFSAGYTGTRAKRTWTDHMNELAKFGFIRIAPTGNSQIGHVLIRNPLVVVEELRKRPKLKVTDEWWNAFLKRASEVGAVLPSEEEADDLPPVPD